jgi:hypothetical protein
VHYDRGADDDFSDVLQVHSDTSPSILLLNWTVVPASEQVNSAMGRCHSSM